MAIVGSVGAWRPSPHPRFLDRRPSLDWPACRAMADGGSVPWPMLRAVLIEVETGAREGVNDAGGEFAVSEDEL